MVRYLIRNLRSGQKRMIPTKADGLNFDLKQTILVKADDHFYMNLMYQSRRSQPTHFGSKDRLLSPKIVCFDPKIVHCHRDRLLSYFPGSSAVTPKDRPLSTVLNFNEFFDEPNLNPYRPKSGPWIEPSNVGSKIGFLKSEPRTKFCTGF